jgi:hypothetical protein
MPQIEQRMSQLLQDHRATLGGRLEDYFGSAYLEIQHRQTGLSGCAPSPSRVSAFGDDPLRMR